MSNHFSLVGPPEVIEEIAALKNEQDVRVGRAQPASTLIDAVDAPIGPETIMALLSTITIVCGSVKAVTDLIEKIREILAKRAGKDAKVTELIIIDPTSGRELARLKSTDLPSGIVTQMLGGSTHDSGRSV